MKSVSVIGIGKLGLSMVGAIASRGVEVWGVDVRRDFIEALLRGECPLVETGLAELLTENRGRIHFTLDLQEAVRRSEATFIVVATPLTAEHRFSNAYLEEAIRGVGRALKGGSRPHLVAVTSTVMPGTTARVIKPLLERESGRKCGEDLMLAYSPEFIALGTVIRDFLEPDWVLVGEDSKAAGDRLEEFYRKVCKNDPPVRRMPAISAEIAKLSLNCYITMKISFANSLAAICERVPGAEALAVLKAIGLDSRIGVKALLPGLGFGGPCFPRDNLAFQTFAREFGASAPLAETVQAVNATQPGRVVELIRSQAPPPATVSILGATYKPKTDVIEEAQPVLIARRLAEAGYRVRIFDPLAGARLEAELGELAEVVSRLEDAVAGAQVCLLGLPWPAEVDPRPCLRQLLAPRLVIDPWHCRRVFEGAGEYQYFSIGSFGSAHGS